jgi:hypothetical protein
MVTATVDNTPVTVLLGNNETYTPASGSVQKVTVAVPSDEEMSITQGTNTQGIVLFRGGSGEPNVGTAELVITDTETIAEEGVTTDRGVYISGFEVN